MSSNYWVEPTTAELCSPVLRLALLQIDMGWFVLDLFLRISSAKMKKRLSQSGDLLIWKFLEKVALVGTISFFISALKIRRNSKKNFVETIKLLLLLLPSFRSAELHQWRTGRRRVQCHMPALGKSTNWGFWRVWRNWDCSIASVQTILTDLTQLC